MHSVLGVRHFIVQVLIWETQGVCSVVSEVVGVHLVVMEEHPAVQVLREEIESHVVDVSWHNFVHWVLLVAPVYRKGQW